MKRDPHHPNFRWNGIRIILILGETGSASNDLNLQHSGMILMSCVDLFSTKYCTSITERPRHRTFFVMKAWDPGSGFAVKCKAGSWSAWKERVCATLIFVVLPRSSCLMILVRTAEPIFFLGLVVSNSSPSTLSTYSNKNKKVKQWRNKREKIMKNFMQLSMNQEKKTRKGINILIWDFSLSV